MTTRKEIDDFLNKNFSPEKGEVWVIESISEVKGYKNKLFYTQHSGTIYIAFYLPKRCISLPFSFIDLDDFTDGSIYYDQLIEIINKFLDWWNILNDKKIGNGKKYKIMDSIYKEYKALNDFYE